MSPLYLAADGTNVAQVTRVSPEILHQEVIASGVTANYGRVPTADHWIVDHLIFINSSATPGTLEFWHLLQDGDLRQDYNILFSELTIAAHETKIYNLTIPMPPNTKFSGKLVSSGDVAIVNFQLFGVKVTD